MGAHTSAMPRQNTSAFALPHHLDHKTDPALIGADDRHFTAISHALKDKVSALSARLDTRRRDPAGRGAQTIDRDADIRRLVAELATLRRFGLDVCIGHFATTGGERVYVGRIGLLDAAGTALLVDWRTPAAEPFFAATLADPRGVTYRRRYRWSGGRIVDYWDEVLGDDDEVAGRTSLDDQSAFVASLSGARTGRMRDVLSTIRSDQDAIIRAGARGALVVDGGPGTGKTVVALQSRAAPRAVPRVADAPARGSGGRPVDGARLSSAVRTVAQHRADSAPAAHGSAGVDQRGSAPCWTRPGTGWAIPTVPGCLSAGRPSVPRSSKDAGWSSTR